MEYITVDLFHALNVLQMHVRIPVVKVGISV